MLIQLLCAEKNRKWYGTIENIDTTKNSKEAWGLIKKLNGDQKIQTFRVNVTANWVTLELFHNGKPKTKNNERKIKRNVVTFKIILRCKS